jgi:DNA-binding protein YbaB
VNGEVRVTNPDQIIVDYEAKLVAAQQKADLMRAEMESVSVGERSKDGQIAVKVNYAGNLVALEIGSAVRDKPSLAQDILRTVQAAQAKLADAVQAGVPSIEGTETMEVLVTQLHAEYPEPEPDVFVEGGGGYGDRPDDETALFDAEDEPATPPPPPPRPTRPAPSGHDDDYFHGGDFLR